MFIGLQGCFLLHLNWVGTNTLLRINCYLPRWYSFIKYKMSKLVDEVYCGGDSVRVLPHNHASYFIIQYLLLASVVPALSLLVLQLSVQFPFPGPVHSTSRDSPFWTWVFPFGDVEINYLYWTRIPSDPSKFPYPHGRFPSSATCIEFSFSSNL